MIDLDNVEEKNGVRKNGREDIRADMLGSVWSRICPLVIAADVAAVRVRRSAQVRLARLDSKV